MTRDVKLSPLEQSLLDQRSDILFYGAAEIFLDGVVDDFSEVSPAATAAKIMTDFVRLYAVLGESCGADPAYDRIDVTAPMGKLIEPLVSGDSAYLNGAGSSAEIFANMLEWVGSTRWFDDVESATSENRPATSANRYVIEHEDGGFSMDGDAIAAYLTLGILLDSADVQIVVDRDLRLDMVHTFRCFSHLFSRLDRVVSEASKEARNADMASRAVFVECLKCLEDDKVMRPEDQSNAAATTD